ncbi:hypothetical protein KM043_009509 [Ampulex compressa]|nr:hypothetical protein KM043_009509 [Ampulex compressa]
MDVESDESNPMADVMDTQKSVEELAEEKKTQANVLYTLKQYKQALAIYNETIELCPTTAHYYGNRAACYMMLKCYRDALNDAKKCIELDPTFFKAYLRIIKCCLVLGDIVGAEATIAKLMELDPQNSLIAPEQKSLEYVQGYLKEADAAYAAKDFRKVVYCMDRCCTVSTSCARFKLTKAECLTLLGRYQEAQEIANDILHIDKQNADAIYVRGMCLYYEDNIEKAIAHFQQVLRLAPDHTKALDIYKKAKLLKKTKEDGNAAFKKKHYLEAYKFYNVALSIDSRNVASNAKIHFNKALVAAKLRRFNESVSECTEALKLDENYLKALQQRASSYMELKQYEDAVHDLEKVCKLEKNRNNTRLLLEAKSALEKSKRKDYYKILGIDKSATIDDIKKAYRKRAMVHHPDRHANATEGEKKEQEKKFKEVGEAYGVLSDPKKRLHYDSGRDYDDGDMGFQDIDPNAVFHTFFVPPGARQFQTSGTPVFTFQFG